MSLEQRLIEALHQVDEYQPSVDLFARTKRSIEEDRRHRRRVLKAGVLSLVGLGGLLALFVSTLDRVDGQLVAPLWVVITARLAVMVALLLVLGPVIRRFGQPFIRAAFNLDGEVGTRFSKVLDVAYYLFFSGLIVASAGLDLEGPVAIPQGLKDPHLNAIAAFTLLLGVGHALNLLAIPVVGLLFGALLRRSDRNRAGEQAPPLSAAALQAERVAKWITYIVGGWVAFQVIGLLIGLALGMVG